MNKKITLSILSSLLLLIGFYLLYKSVNNGISIQGLWLERIILIIFISLSIYNLKDTKGLKDSKIRTWSVINLLTPVLTLIITLIFNPTLTFYLLFKIMLGLLTPENYLFENDNYIVKKSNSFMTNSIYNIYEKRNIWEYKISEFGIERTDSLNIEIINDTIYLNYPHLIKKINIKKTANIN